MYNVKAGDVVGVYWHDACGDHTGWRDVRKAVEETKNMRYPVWSVGIVIAADDECIRMTHMQAVTVGSECGGTEHIPWDYIDELWVYERGLIIYGS